MTQFALVKVVGKTLVNPDGTVRSLSPAIGGDRPGQPGPDGGPTWGPYTWVAMPPGTAGQFEVCVVNGNTVVFNPTTKEAVVFAFEGTVPNTSGFSAISLKPL